jgi:flagellin-specific chaperone FliS
MNLYDDEEIQIITNAISRHCDKDIIQEPYDEVLKDGDVMSHCLYNTDFQVKAWEIERYKSILTELGCAECG